MSLAAVVPHRRLEHALSFPGFLPTEQEAVWRVLL
jgi:hypothetical protein